MYSGIVKSFNWRRGFGFLVCEETSKDYLRDVFVSKAECDGQELEEGDLCTFDLIISPDGHPQALNARKCTRYEGRVLDTMPGSYIVGNIQRLSDPPVKVLPGVEIHASKSEVGVVVLHPGDLVAFSGAIHGNTRQFATTSNILLQQPASSSISSCFELDHPLHCRGHTIDNQMILQLPENFDVELLKKTLPKIGAVNLTFNGRGTSGQATFSSVQALCKILNHRSLGLPRMDDSKTGDTAAVLLRPPTSQLDPFWPAPTLTKTRTELRWETQFTAAKYILQVRFAAAPSSFVWLDESGHVMETAYQLESSARVVDISALEPVVEARLAYISTCGCISAFGHAPMVHGSNLNKIDSRKVFLAPPATPEILRNTQNGTSIRWQAQEGVSEYFVEVMHDNGDMYTTTIQNQTHLELQGDDLVWARVGYLKGTKLSPPSAKLRLPSRTSLAWTIDEGSNLPRRRCVWDQAREPIMLWLD